MEWERAQEVVVTAALAQGLRVVVAMATQTAMAPLVPWAAAKAVGRERGRPVKQVDVHSFPTLARIPMMRASIPTASIRLHGCGLKGVRST
ncbi:hypothetical protein D3C86_1933610 [compost metagenome]